MPPLEMVQEISKLPPLEMLPPWGGGLSSPRGLSWPAGTDAEAVLPPLEVEQLSVWVPPLEMLPP